MPVTKLDMDFIMTASAKTHEIALFVRPASIHRQNVMYFLDGRRSARFQAHLAQRMFSHITCPDTLPFRAVLPVMLWRALVFVIAFSRLLFVLLAIGAVRKAGTARKGARLFRFMRHNFSPHKQVDFDQLRNALKFYAHSFA